MPREAEYYEITPIEQSDSWMHETHGRPPWNARNRAEPVISTESKCDSVACRSCSLSYKVIHTCDRYSRVHIAAVGTPVCPKESQAKRRRVSKKHHRRTTNFHDGSFVT